MAPRLLRPELRGPGVYVQEVPSDNHTISESPTAVTAFVGRTRWGPVATPTFVHSHAEFLTRFGGPERGLGYLASCVEDFFLNGGEQAIIVRLFQPDPGADEPASTGTLALGAGMPRLAAASPGAWARRLSAAVDREGLPPPDGADASTPSDRFNLTLTLDAGNDQQIVERLTAVSPDPATGYRQLSEMLEHQSRLARVASPSVPYGTGSDGAPLRDYRAALDALDGVEPLGLLCVPPDTELGDSDGLSTVHRLAYAAFAEWARSRRVFLIVDTPPRWSASLFDRAALTAGAIDEEIGIPGRSEASRHAAAYLPWLSKGNELDGGAPWRVPPCGAVAGIMARTDRTRGVWKAPAGVGATIVGIVGLAHPITEAEAAHLAGLGVNCLRAFPSTGPVVWGARTLYGGDPPADDFTYVPVRRLADHIEQSLRRGSVWVALERNGEPLWARIRRHVDAFMTELFRQGALRGASAEDAFQVVCDATVHTPSDIEQGVLNVVIRYAPLKPGEYLVLHLRQQTSGA